MKETICALALLILITSCASVEDPYKSQVTPDEVVTGIKQKKQWYCGKGMLGIRAVFRFGLRMAGVPVIDLCKAVDAIVEYEST